MLKLDFNKHTFSLQVKNVDLTGLGCPLSVEIELGDYYSHGQADEKVVNAKKPIPMQLMNGYADRLQVDKIKVKKGKKPSTDSLMVKGTFALENKPSAIGNVIVTLGSQDFAIAGSSFTTTKNGAEVCKKANVNEGGIANVKFDPIKSSFVIIIKKTTVESTSGKVDFCISAFGSFNECVEVDL